MASLKQVKSKQTVYLDKPPCCLEFFPNSSDFFVVGTYNLVQSEPGSVNHDESPAPKSSVQRNGSLVIFQLEADDIIELDSVEVPYGVLDIHFHDSRLGVATSTGSFALFNTIYSVEGYKPSLSLVVTLQLAPPDIVITSFAWDPSSDGHKIAATMSSGVVDVVSLPEDIPSHHDSIENDITQEPLWLWIWDYKDHWETVFTHSLEAWIAAFTPLAWSLRPSRLFSGGDDAVLSFAPLHESQSTPVTTSSNRRIHSAGVTAILPIPTLLTSPFSVPLSLAETPPQDFPEETKQKYRLLITGSYDDALRVLHLCSSPTERLAPRVLHEVNMGGGVWRVAFLNIDLPSELHHETPGPRTPQAVNGTVTLLVSAMYAGAFVVRLKFYAPPGHQLDVTSEILAHFGEHESMCYCCDAAPARPDAESGSRRQIVSCSFYDKRVCLWEW